MASRKVQAVMNKAGAVLMPLVITGLVGYATWVEVDLVGVNYLLHPPAPYHSRTGPAVVVITLYLVLLVLAVIAYLRTVYVVIYQPGYVPLAENSRRDSQQKAPKSRRRNRNRDPEKAESSTNTRHLTPSQQIGYLDRGAVYTGRITPPPGLDKFWKRDVFECEVDGLPRYCLSCGNWKPDRSHHSSEAGRCVFKFDHFCPWVGGIVGESAFKFFVQFCFYAAIMWAYVVITLAYFVAERNSKTGTLDVNWIIVLAVAGVFFLFASGMVCNATYSICLNMTTIDKLSRGSRMHFLAVLIPPEKLSYLQRQRVLPYPMIAYPLPDRTRNAPAPSPSSLRHFAVLETPLGSNPYRMSSNLENFKSVMGNNVVDWFLPIRRSPCCSHRHYSNKLGRTMYPLGPVVDEVVAAAGLTSSDEEASMQPRDGRPQDTVASQQR